MLHINFRGTIAWYQPINSLNYIHKLGQLIIRIIRKAMSGVRVLGEGAATPSPPAMCLESAVSIPGGSRAKPSRQTDVFRGSA